LALEPQTLQFPGISRRKGLVVAFDKIRALDCDLLKPIGQFSNANWIEVSCFRQAITTPMKWVIGSVDLSG